MHKDSLFCSKCLIHDHFFVGGGSWSSDCCPKCRGIDCVMYKNLSIVNKIKAKKLFKMMWNRKHKIHGGN